MSAAMAALSARTAAVAGIWAGLALWVGGCMASMEVGPRAGDGGGDARVAAAAHRSAIST